MLSKADQLYLNHFAAQLGNRFVLTECLVSEADRDFFVHISGHRDRGRMCPSKLVHLLDIGVSVDRKTSLVVDTYCKIRHHEIMLGLL